MVRDINPFSIDSFAEHTRAGHGQWMAIDNWLALKSPGKNQAKLWSMQTQLALCMIFTILPTL